MKVAKKVLGFLAGILIVLCVSVAAQPPPAGVDTILKALGELEESFEKRDWGEALTVANRIDNELLDVLVASRLEAPLLEQALVKVKGAIHEGNSIKVEVNYILLQKRFVGFLDNFTFEIHPVFELVAQSLDQAKEAAEKSEFDDVANEMAEAGNMLREAHGHYQKSGMTDREFSEFNAKVVSTIKAARRKNSALVNQELKVVSDMHASFLARGQ